MPPVSSSSARTNGLDSSTLTDCAIAFCERVLEDGYTPMVYFNQNVGYTKFQLDRLTDYDFWYAQYPSKSAMYPAMYYNHQIWQYSSSGTVAVKKSLEVKTATRASQMSWALMSAVMPAAWQAS